MKENKSNWDRKEDVAISVDGRVPPYSQEAERACLGCILLDNSTIPVIMNIIQPEHFYIEANRRIFETMEQLYSRSEPIDAVTLGTQLKENGDLEKAGGAIAIASLTDQVAVVSNIQHYAEIVKKTADARRMIYAAMEVAASGFSSGGDVSEYLASSSRIISQAANTGAVEGTRRLGELIPEVIVQLENKEPPKGLVKTGIEAVDKLTGGLQPGLVTVVGGRPSMGKTAFALNVGINAAISEQSVLSISMEDVNRFVVLRTISRFANIDLDSLVLNDLTSKQWHKIIEAILVVDKIPYYVNDSPSRTADQIRQIAEIHKQRFGLDLLIIDHLGEIIPRKSSGSKTDDTEEAMRAIRDLAKEEMIPAMLLTQLNRDVERREDKRPRLSDLRQTGAIEQMARIVWFLYRRGYYKMGCEDDPDMLLIVSKNSHGKTGAIKLWGQLANMYIRSWDITQDGVFPEEGSGPYQAPEGAEGWKSGRKESEFFRY